MTPKLSQQAKGVMSPIHGPVHWQATSRIPYRGTSKPDVFLNVGDEGVFHYEGTYFFFFLKIDITDFGDTIYTIS